MTSNVVLPLLILLWGCRENPRSASVMAEDEAQRLTRLLAGAMRREDESEIMRLVSESKTHLGAKVGVPESPDEYRAVAWTAEPLDTAEARKAFLGVIDHLPSITWWRIGLDPAKSEHLPREVGAVISGCVAAYRAGVAGADDALREAKAGGDYLIWTQQQGGNGVIPFPAFRNGKGNAFESAERQFRTAEKDGRLGEMIHNGWAIDDFNGGGMQFDNGECAAALLDLYESTGDPRYLTAAKASADWTLTRAVVPNWNYNSFSVYLLARLYQVTREAKYLDAAKRKATFGVYPGQLTGGQYAGRWFDPHNAKPAYHYILTRSLVVLVAAMDNADTARPKAIAALTLALQARNKDFREKGIPDKNKTLEALLLMKKYLANETALFSSTQSDTAIEALSRTVSEEYRRARRQGRTDTLPLSPGAWGAYLEYTLRSDKKGRR